MNPAVIRAFNDELEKIALTPAVALRLGGSKSPLLRRLGQGLGKAYMGAASPAGQSLSRAANTAVAAGQGFGPVVAAKAAAGQIAGDVAQSPTAQRWLRKSPAGRKTSARVRNATSNIVGGVASLL